MQLNFKTLPVFCISLERSTERRNHVEREFDKAGIEFTFYDAVDKSHLLLPELSEKKSDNNAIGALACMMSHWYLMKYAILMQYEAICVFEDDVVLCEDFKDRIAYIQQNNIEFDMLLLGGHFDARIPGTLLDAAEGTDDKHIFAVKRMAGSYGYIISKKVMEFCVRNLTYQWGMDQFFSDVVYKRFNCVAFLPFLVGCRPCVSEITGVFWKYDMIDKYYEPNAIDLSSPYKNQTEEEEAKKIKIIDKTREQWLKENP